MALDHLSRIAKLLALAEGASGPEAEAAYAKAQELATNHAIDLEVARRRMADSNKRETPISKRINFETELASRNTKKSLVELFLVIAQVNDCKVNVYNSSTGVIVFGMPSDIEVVEGMFGIIAVQMISGADAFLKTKAYREEFTTYYDADGYPSTKRVDGRTARLNYYQNFCWSISKRLKQMKADAEASRADERVTVGTTSTGHDVSTSVELVLVEKRHEVAQFYANVSTARGSWKGSSTNSYSSSASDAGRSDGSRAKIGRQAQIGGSRTALR